MQPLLSTARAVVEIARSLHAVLGHRLSAEAYEAALVYELERGGLRAQRQVPVALQHDGCELDMGYVADILVEDGVVVRLAAIQRVDLQHEGWLLQRLALPGPCVGLFLDFGRPQLEHVELAGVAEGAA